MDSTIRIPSNGIVNSPEGLISAKEIADIEDPDEWTRLTAMHWFAEHPRPEAVEPIIHRSQVGSHSELLVAIIALGMLGDKRALPVLLEVLDNAEAVSRAATKRDTAKPPDSVRWKLALKLSRRLRDLVAYSDATGCKLIKMRAAYSLGQLGDESAIPVLQKWLTESDITVRQRCQDAINRIRTTHSQSDTIAE